MFFSLSFQRVKCIQSSKEQHHLEEKKESTTTVVTLMLPFSSLHLSLTKVT